MTNGLNNTTTFGYDSASGNLATIDQPMVGGQIPHQSLTYNSIGHVLSVTALTSPG
jgi:hypothetical protein